MDLKLISASCRNSRVQHSFDLSIPEHFCFGMCGVRRGAGFIPIYFFPCAAFMLTVNLSGSRCPVALSKARLSMTNSRAVNSKVYLFSCTAHSLSVKINLSGSGDTVSIISIVGLRAALTQSAARIHRS